MVQHPDPDQLQRGDQLTRDGPISLAWLRHPAGVVMRQDAGAGVDRQGRSDDFPGVDAGAVQRAGKEVLAIQDPVAVIQPEDVEFFMQAGAEPHAEKVAGFLGVTDAALAFELRAQEGFGRAEDVVFGDGAAALVVAVAVLDEAHVVLPRRGIAPWAPGRGARKVGSTGTPTLCGGWRRKQRGRGLALAPTDRAANLAHTQVQARAEGDTWGSFDGDHVLGVTPARFRPSDSMPMAKLLNYSGHVRQVHAARQVLYGATTFSNLLPSPQRRMSWARALR